MKPMFALQLHVSLWLAPVHPRYESLAQPAPPLILGLSLRILLGSGFPPHHSDFSLAEPTMRSRLIQSESLQSLLLLSIFVIVVLTLLILLRRLLFFRGGLNWLLGEHFFYLLEFFGWLLLRLGWCRGFMFLLGRWWGYFSNYFDQLWWRLWGFLSWTNFKGW
jgi:hypothetical protein